MKPRLRPHVQITRQHFRGRRWHVVHDPSSNQFYRLNSVAHEFVGLLDGHRTVEAVWQHSLTRHADDALTQNEVLQLLSQLYGSNLLAADVSPETEQLLRRGRERFAQRAKQQAIGLMYFKMRLFNPDAILAWLEPIFRPLISPVGFVLWCLWILAAIGFVVVPNWSVLISGVDSAVAPSNWGWMFAIFVVLKLIHETGHGLICRRFGGQVPEFGAMLLVLIPAPYVDASSAWAFPSKWRRMAVGAGGMIFELTVAAAAAFTWMNTASDSLLHQLAYNAIFSASVSTVLFNANPLMKFDGYYILSDLLEVPNLMQRSTGMLKFLIQRHLFQIKGAVPPTGSPSEAVILVVYGVGAMAYRIFLFVSITLYVMGQMFAIGLFLAAWTATMWFVLPVGGCVHWLATSPQIADRRPRTIAITLVLAGLVLMAVGVIPAPDRRRARGVVESPVQPSVYFGTDGFVMQALVKPGEHVKAGQPMVVMESDSLLAQLEMTRAVLAEAEGRAFAAAPYNPAATVAAQEFADAVRQQITWAESKIEALTIRAPHDGVVVGQDPQSMVGKFVHEGQPLCEVVSEQDLRVAAVLTQTEASWLRQGPAKVEVRLISRLEQDPVEARTEKIIDAGTRDLPHEALSYKGGGTIETQADDKSGRLSKGAVFKGYFVPVDAASFSTETAKPGERVVLRFTLDSKPLLSQWWLRLRQTLQGRAKV
ncbi:putative peptide zinc metalloprotease protein [Phycisphaerales bacterium]|nr:putative peptide zinc metalloprotease protein [Phycisphaerales bacterium]